MEVIINTIKICLKLENNMKTLLIISIIIFTISCEKKAETDIGDTHFRISVLDSTGADLLDTLNPNSYPWDSIRIYNVINGIPVMYYYSNRGLQYGYLITNELTQYYHLLTDPDRFAHPDEEENYMMYIAWTKEDLDTILCETKEPYEGRKFIEKIYYNGELSWNAEIDTTDKHFIIIK